MAHDQDDAYCTERDTSESEQARRAPSSRTRVPKVVGWNHPQGTQSLERSWVGSGAAGNPELRVPHACARSLLYHVLMHLLGVATPRLGLRCDLRDHLLRDVVAASQAGSLSLRGISHHEPADASRFNNDTPSPRVERVSAGGRDCCGDQSQLGGAGGSWWVHEVLWPAPQDPPGGGSRVESFP